MEINIRIGAESKCLITVTMIPSRSGAVGHVTNTIIRNNMVGQCVLYTEKVASSVT